jgi:hypothetical protein
MASLLTSGRLAVELVSAAAAGGAAALGAGPVVWCWCMVTVYGKWV